MGRYNRTKISFFKRTFLTIGEGVTASLEYILMNAKITLTSLGKLYCEDCYGTFLAPDCSKCRKKILGVRKVLSNSIYTCNTFLMFSFIYMIKAIRFDLCENEAINGSADVLLC